MKAFRSDKQQNALPSLSSIGDGGFTLFEIVLALGIFLSSMAALSQLPSNGMRAAVLAQRQTEAMVRCESKLSEVMAGVEAQRATTNVAFPDDPKWVWRMNVRESQFPGVLLLEVRVSHWEQRSVAATTAMLQCFARDRSAHDEVRR